MNGFSAVIAAKAGIQWLNALIMFPIRSPYDAMDSGESWSDEVGVSYAIARYERRRQIDKSGPAMLYSVR